MSTLPLDEDGWPAWPPRDPAIWDSLRQVFDSGDWGRYQSEVSAQCVRSIEQMLLPTLDAHSLPSPWHAHYQRIFVKPEVRLCSSGTMAVELALRGCGVRAGDEVVVAAYDYPGNFRSIELLGAMPVLADVRPGGVTMDPESLQQIDGKKIKAVIVSHLYGELTDMTAIRDICDARGWSLIEDACQVPGAGWVVGQAAVSSGVLPIGVLSDCLTLSFGGSKLLSAGNGGALIARDERIAARVRAYVERPSDAVPLSPLQAAVLLPQFAMLAELNQRRSVVVERLRQYDWPRLGASVLTATGREQIGAYYKFALLASKHREQAGGEQVAHERSTLIVSLQSTGLPVGEGFRSTHGTSDRRSRKPVPLEHSRRAGTDCVVLDHRALLAVDWISRLDAI